MKTVCFSFQYSSELSFRKLYHILIQLWMNFSLRYQGRQLGCIAYPFQVKVRNTQTFCKKTNIPHAYVPMRLARIFEWIEGGIQTVEGESLNNIVYSHYLLIIGPRQRRGKTPN